MVLDFFKKCLIQKKCKWLLCSIFLPLSYFTKRFPAYSLVFEYYFSTTVKYNPQIKFAASLHLISVVIVLQHKLESVIVLFLSAQCCEWQGELRRVNTCLCLFNSSPPFSLHKQTPKAGYINLKHKINKS